MKIPAVEKKKSDMTDVCFLAALHAWDVACVFWNGAHSVSHMFKLPSPKKKKKILRPFEVYWPRLPVRAVFWRTSIVALNTSGQ